MPFRMPSISFWSQTLLIHTSRIALSVILMTSRHSLRALAWPALTVEKNAMHAQKETEAKNHPTLCTTSCQATPSPSAMRALTPHSSLTIKSRLNGNDESVTVTTSPDSSSSLSDLSRFGRVATSSWGGACMYSDFVARRSDGRRICLCADGTTSVSVVVLPNSFLQLTREGNRCCEAKVQARTSLAARGACRSGPATSCSDPARR